MDQRIWAEINLDNLEYNYNQVQQCAPSKGIYCIIKANGYGHGAVPVARALADGGATHFAVAAPEEALQLRRHGIAQPILLLGLVDASWIPSLVYADIAVTVDSLSTARSYAQISGRPITLHIKVDTGMHRLGLCMDMEQAIDEICEIIKLPNVIVEGLFTHFASADEPEEDDFTRQQMDSFNSLCKRLEQKGVYIPIKHCSNSAAVIAHDYTHVDMVRPGIMLYGYNPVPGNGLRLKPVLSLRARISQVLHVRKGESVSYGRIWYAPHDCTIATISAGYADGIFRVLSNRMQAIVHGQRVKQVGRICMDMCMLDVSGLDVRAGDAATIMGCDGDECIWADEISGLIDTIPYEILCALNMRVTRMYTRAGQAVSSECYFDKV